MYSVKIDIHLAKDHNSVIKLFMFKCFFMHNKISNIDEYQ